MLVWVICGGEREGMCGNTPKTFELLQRGRLGGRRVIKMDFGKKYIRKL